MLFVCHTEVVGDGGREGQDADGWAVTLFRRTTLADEGPIRNAHLVDKPSRWPGVRSLSLKSGASQGGRLYWYTKYPAADKAAKDSVDVTAGDRVGFGAQPARVRDRLERLVRLDKLAALPAGPAPIWLVLLFLV